MRVYKIPQRRNRLSFLRGLSINTILILLNVIFFIVFTLLIGINFLAIDDIAIMPANIFQGEYLWTFLTSIFMHASFFHLFANMLSLLFIGGLIEKILGRKRYLWFYLSSGLFAGLFFVISGLFFVGDLNTYAVGASGAIFGLIGFLMLITPNLPVYIMFIPIPVKMKYAAPGILIVLWLVSIAGNVPIGNMAHLGGLIAGVIYALYLRNKYKNKTKMISRHFS